MIYGSSLYGTHLYGVQSNQITYPTDLVVFNGLSLADNVTTFCSSLDDDMPTVEIIGGKVPRDDGEYTIGTYWREKKITLSGLVKKSSNADLESVLDQIRLNLGIPNASLDITRNGVAKRYTATCTNPEKIFARRKYFHVTMCPYDIEFTCRIPFGKDRSYSNVWGVQATSPFTLAANNAGTYKAKPVITLNFTAASGITSINVTNSTTADQMEVDTTIASGDVLMFDCEQKTVTQNGNNVAFSGSFLSLAAGTNSVVFTINGTFSVSATIAWLNTWM